MTVVELRLAGNVASLLSGLDQVNARMDKMEFSANRLQSSFDRTFSFATVAAGISAAVIGLDRFAEGLDKIISRYNTLAGLERANLYFGSQRESEAMLRGLGDIGRRSEAQSQTNRLLSGSAGKYMDLELFQTMGQASRGFLLAGETGSIAEGLHAQELFITGGQSRMLHRLGVGVETAYGYRQYAAARGLRQADMTGEQRMEARIEELQRAASYYNTAGFGAAAQSTSFQQLTALGQNVNDSYVRSLAGSIEMLAQSLGKLENINADKVGQTLAVLAPLGLGAVSIGTTLAGFGSRIAPMQQSLPGLRGQLEDVTERMQFAQGSQGRAFTQVGLAGQAAEAANLGEQTARRIYADQIGKIVPATFRDPVTGGLLPLEDTQSYNYNLAAQSRQTRLARFYEEAFDKEPTEYNFMQASEFQMRERAAKMEAVAIEQRYADVQSRLTDSRLMANGEMLRFEQTSAGSAATAQAARARGAVGVAEETLARRTADTEGFARSQRIVQSELDATNRSINTQNRVMAAFIGFELGIAAVSAAWVAYGNAVRGAEQAQQGFLRTAKASGGAGAELYQTQQGGGGITSLRRQLQVGGMGQDAINQFQAAYRPGMSQDELATLYAQISLEAGRDDFVAAEIKGANADRWLNRAGRFVVGPLWNKFAPGILGMQTPETDAQINTRYDAWIRGAVRDAPALAAAEAAAVKEMEQMQVNKQYETLQGRISFQRSQMGQFQSLSGGFNPRTSYADQYQRNIDRMLIGFDPSQLAEPQRGEFGAQQSAAIEREIGRDKEEESKRIRQNIDAYDKESRARLAVAAMQDQSLGPARKLVDETATEAARRQNASQLISAYESALVEGNQALIDEISARGDLKDALRIQALSGLNLAREMENTVSSLRQQIPGLYGEAAGLFQAQVGAQTSIEQGLNSNNPYMSRLMGLQGQMLGLQPQIGQLEQQQALVEAMRAIMGGELPATAASKFGLPMSMASALLSFSKNDPNAQAAAIASQESANFGLRRQLISGVGGFLGEVSTFRNSLNPVGGLDQKDRALVEAMQASGIVGDLFSGVGSIVGYAGGEGLINQASLGRFSQSFGGKLPLGNPAAMVQASKTGLDAVVDQQAILVLSLGALQASVDRLTVTLGGSAPASVPGATSGELWGGTVGAAAAAGGVFINSLGLPPAPSDSLPADLKSRSTTGFVPDEGPSGFVPAHSSDDLFLGIPSSSVPTMAPISMDDVQVGGAVIGAEVGYDRGSRLMEDRRRSRSFEVASNVWNFQRGRGRRLYGRSAPMLIGPPQMPGWDGAASGWADPPYDPSQSDYYSPQAGGPSSFTGFTTENYYVPYEKDCGPEG